MNSRQQIHCDVWPVTRLGFFVIVVIGIGCSGRTTDSVAPADAPAPYVAESDGEEIQVINWKGVDSGYKGKTIIRGDGQFENY